MAWPFTGNINSGTVDSQSQNLAMTVSSFTLVPKGGSAVVNVYKITASNQTICIMPNNYNISANQMYQATNPTVLLATEKIRVQVTGNVDYDFYVENLKKDNF